LNEKRVLKSTHSYKPGYYKRYFIEIPSDVTSAVIEIKNCNLEENGVFVLHTQQLLPLISNRSHAFHKDLSLAAQAVKSYSIGVRGGHTLEICFGKWWQNYGETEVSLCVEFHGLQPSLNSISMVFIFNKKLIEI
jgi:hypothetical protein